jgi:hypothetical protein
VTAARTPTKQSLGRYAGLSSCAAAAAPTKKEFQIKQRRQVKNTLRLGHAHFEKKTQAIVYTENSRSSHTDGQLICPLLRCFLFVF